MYNSNLKHNFQKLIIFQQQEVILTKKKVKIMKVQAASNQFERQVKNTERKCEKSFARMLYIYVSKWYI